MNTKAQAHMEYSEDIVLMLTVNREDVLRPYQSHKLVWAGIQWLEAPLLIFSVLWLNLAVQARLMNTVPASYPSLSSSTSYWQMPEEEGHEEGLERLLQGRGGEEVALGDVGAQVGILK